MVTESWKKIRTVPAVPPRHDNSAIGFVGFVASHLKNGLVNSLLHSMDSRGKAKQTGYNKKRKSTQGGSSQDISFSFQNFQNPNYQQYQNYQQNQNYPQQYFPVQQSYNTFRLPEENKSYNPWNQFSQRVPETQFQSSQPENFQFRDAQNEESGSSNDDPALERNEEETSEELCNTLKSQTKFSNFKDSKQT
uniref:Uncharacterized protein n=1 Tax=Lactuca sativa TaxID=4236 RepID=A0A9R1VB23_LACSA|nr:hypothetical protein LSAT_V11C500238040 [Lactuca sativa]